MSNKPGVTLHTNWKNYNTTANNAPHLKLCLSLKMPERSTSTTRNSKNINATPGALYQAFSNPKALELWLAPGEMTGKVHSFDFRVGGGYTMSLFYPASERQFQGKTTEKEDRYTARFIELDPNRKIVQAITFDSPDPSFSGEMIMEVTFEKISKGTKVVIIFNNIPAGISPEDNEAGTELTLDKLAKYVASQTSL